MIEHKQITKTIRADNQRKTPPSAKPAFPTRAPASPLVQIQRNLGNEAFGHIFQAKLEVNQPGDIYEQEADRVAEQVMRMPEPAPPQPVSGTSSGIQRKCAACASDGLCSQCAEEEEQLQRTPLATQITPLIQRQETEEEEEETFQAKEASSATLSVSPAVESHISAMRGGGQPLPPSVRAFFEPRFGYDFGQVRVHTDVQAAESTQAVNALAYTVGRNIVFRAGQYAPGTNEGRRLLAHELTHVMQQSQSAEITPTVQSISLPSNRFARQADLVATQIKYERHLPTTNLTHTAPLVQRACGRAGIGHISGCTGLSGGVTGEPFLFIVSCDDFRRPPIDPIDYEANLRAFAHTLGSGDIVGIHGFASEEGLPDFNEDLACRRAHRAFDILIHEGIPAHRIRRLFSHGATPGPRPERRSVVIDVQTLPLCGPDATQWFVDQINHSMTDPAVLAIQADIAAADVLARPLGTTAQQVAEGGAAAAVMAQEARMGSLAPPRTPTATTQIATGTAAGVMSTSALAPGPITALQIIQLITRAALAWRALVNHGARFDFKAHVMSSPTTAHCPDALCRNTITLCSGGATENCYLTDLPGNFFYAAIGRFVGWSELTLQLGSQLAQLTGTGTWDPPPDTAAVHLGFSLPLPLSMAGLCGVLPGARSSLTSRSGCLDCEERVTTPPV